MLNSACSSRCSQRWRRPGRRVQVGERVELVSCPLGQRGRGPRGAEALDRRMEERAGPRQAEPGGSSCQSPGSGGPQKAPGGGVGCELVPALSPSYSHSTGGVSGSAPHSKGQGAGDGGRLGRGQGVRDRSPPGGGTGGRQRQKGPEARVGSPGRERTCTSLLAEPPGGDQPPDPRIEVPVAAGPPFVRNSIRWQSRY